jgi:hypothetical protein
MSRYRVGYCIGATHYHSSILCMLFLRILDCPKREDRRTKILCLRNIRFFKDRHLSRCHLQILNQLTAWPSLSKCKRMTASLIQSITIGRTILFSALSYNGPNWLTEFGATGTQHAIHQSARFDAMEDLTRSHQRKYCWRSAPQARQAEVHASVSSQARW